MPGGKPPKYSNVEELEEVLNSYFTEIPESRLTVTGLALHLGFTSRQALMNYQDKPEYVDSIKKAKLRIEQAYELSLRENGRSGDIFGLKNFGWNDRQEIDTNNKNINVNADVSAMTLEEMNEYYRKIIH